MARETHQPTEHEGPRASRPERRYPPPGARRRLATGLIAAAAIVLAVQPAGAGTLAAQPGAPARAVPAAGVIRVVGTSAGFTAPDRHPAGQVTFEVSTSHPEGGLFSLLKLRPGVALDDLLGDLMSGLSEDRAEAVAGGRAVQAKATLLGGAAVLPGQPISFTRLLTPGTYHLVNYRDLIEGGVEQAAERLGTLTITSRWSSARPPHAAATAVFALAGGHARFLMPTTLRSGSPLRMVNAMPQLGEAVFMPVRPGTTRAQLVAFFETVDQGGWADSPIIGDPVGVPALGPGQAVVVEIPLPPGPYALVTWYPSLRDGTMLAALGQVEVVTIT